MFSVSISLGNLFTAPLLSYPSLRSSSPLESILPPSHCNAAPVIAPNRLSWLEEPRGWGGGGGGQKEGKQDEKLISRRLKPTAPTAAPLRSLWHKVGAPRLAPIKVDYGNCGCLPCSRNAPRQLIFLTGNEPLPLWFSPNGPSVGQTGPRALISVLRGGRPPFPLELIGPPPPSGASG